MEKEYKQLSLGLPLGLPLQRRPHWEAVPCRETRVTLCRPSGRPFGETPSGVLPSVFFMEHVHACMTLGECVYRPPTCIVHINICVGAAFRLDHTT